MKETVLITGGTGLVGKHLVSLLLKRGYQVKLLSRQEGVITIDGQQINLYRWNVDHGSFDSKALEQVDHIIHLAGAGVADRRWSEQRKLEILQSRTKSSALLVKALQETPNKVRSVISASAIGWYGPDEENTSGHPFTEDMPSYPNYLGETCQAWEAGIQPVTALGKRLVTLRIGIVLSTAGGALEAFRKPLQAGVAAILGNGHQIISWVHVNDLCNIFLFALANTQLEGSYNAVSPYPVSNKELILTLARQLRGKWFIPIKVPAFVLKIVLGEMSIEILKSATVSSQKIQLAGFQFSYPDIDSAIKNLIAVDDSSPSHQSRQ